MQKGFFIGVTIGVVATMLYEAGCKAKKGIEKGKKMVKEKISDFMD